MAYQCGYFSELYRMKAEFQVDIVSLADPGFGQGGAPEIFSEIFLT